MAIQYQGYPDNTDITYHGHPLDQLPESHRLILETVRARAGGYTIRELEDITGMSYQEIIQIGKDLRTRYRVAIKSISVGLGARGQVIHRLFFATEHFPKWKQELEGINYEYKIVD